MSKNPYRIEAPALISFSGGRTSGYMLWHILDAYNWELPDNLHITFANTGREREETLRFVHNCGVHWNAKIRWLEWRDRPKGKEGRDTPVEQRFEEVGYNSASRNGEPFSAVMRRKSYLPNSVTRFCTTELKIKVMEWFMLSHGYSKWTNVIGLRGDEMGRVFKAMERNDAGNQRWTSVMPMATQAAGMVRQQDVLDFWAKQSFDLELKHYEGNCDLCFLKGKAKIKRLIRDDKTLADWWIKQERDLGATFNKDWSYADLVKEVAQSPLLPLDDETSDEFDAECGLWCSGEIE